jgi:hypothetical protein
MKARIFWATAAALSLAACGKPAGTGAEASASATTASLAAASPTQPAVPPAAASGSVPTRDYLIGKWAMNGDDCSTIIEYRADGAFLGPSGKEGEHWQLNGAELTNTIFPGKMILAVVDQKHMDVTDPDQPGPPHRVTRC